MGSGEDASDITSPNQTATVILDVSNATRQLNPSGTAQVDLILTKPPGSRERPGHAQNGGFLIYYSLIQKFYAWRSDELKQGSKFMPILGRIISIGGLGPALLINGCF
jgi:hypothetical protein